MRAILLSLVVATATPTVLVAQKACALQGMWQVDSVKTNGQVRAAKGRMFKLLTATHFAWVSQLSDSVRTDSTTATMAPRSGSASEGASGTYSVTGNRYTEHLEVFPVRPLIGQVVEATCQVKGDRRYHRWHVRGDTTQAGEEVWKRIGR